MTILSGSLRQRLTRLAFVTLGVAGFIIALVEAIGEFAASQESLIENTEVLLDVTSESIAPYLAAADPAAAHTHLRELIVRSDILAARIRLPDGMLFVENTLAPERLAQLRPSHQAPPFCT